jgi:hypothetical protein
MVFLPQVTNRCTSSLRQSPKVENTATSPAPPRFIITARTAVINLGT